VAFVPHVSLLGQTATQVAKPQIRKAVPTGGWSVSASKSEMSDLPIVVARLNADASLPGIVGTVRPTLIVRCREKELEAYIDTQMVVSDDGPNRLRWDAAEPSDDYSWRQSTSLKALFTSEANDFVTSLLEHRRLRFEFEPFGRANVVASFTLTGFAGVLPKIRAACPDVAFVEPRP
jgi:hypothetical protein